MNKKIIYSVLAIVLAGSVISIYFWLGGNPLHKAKAKEQLETYLEAHYSDLDYSIKSGAKYTSIDDSYRFHVLVKNQYDVETDYIFDVYNYAPFKVFNDTIHKSRIDEQASKKLNASAEAYIFKLLKKDIPQLRQVDTDVEVYQDADKWTPKLHMPKPITIMLEIEKKTLTKAQILEQCQHIRLLLNEQEIDYTIAEAGYASMINRKEEIWYVDIDPKKQLTMKDIDSVK